jgi:phytoene/squalene synthetase
MERFGVTEAQLREGRALQNFRDLIRFEVDRTEKLFDEGEQLLATLDGAVRRHIALFGMGGRAVLEAIRRQNYDTLTTRPSLSHWQKGRLAARAAASQLLGVLNRRASL